MVSQSLAAITGYTKQTLIYAGNNFSGVDASSALSIRAMLTRVGHNVSFFESSDIETLPIERAADYTIVMGGGRCSEWDKIISKRARDALYSFIEAGAKYVGICAGAYWCCRRLTYHDCGTILKRERESPVFFDGEAIGPLYPVEEIENIHTVGLKWSDDGSLCNSIVINGGYFTASSGPSKHSSFEVLATYVDSPEESSVAIVRTQVNKGTATLCFPHLEYDSVFISGIVRSISPVCKTEKWTNMAQEMSDGDEVRERLFMSLFPLR